jgi:hypothetical protein
MMAHTDRSIILIRISIDLYSYDDTLTEDNFHSRNQLRWQL